ncbi:hypothetical protein B0H19DRAFT_957768 [Mycena capillaripes]|nr:hypothetical protein B0H19DRAFT_957768 [Mycena capillaripes]
MLPRRTAWGAPEFDGKALSLKHYWEDVEEVAEACGKTTDDDKIKVASRYIAREDELLWKGCVPKDGTPILWASFKSEVEKLYPGADGHKIFTTSDLESFIAARAGTKIGSKDDLSSFHRKFKTIANHLIAEGKVTELETRREFPEGMDKEFRNRVYRRLQITKPDHLSDTPYKVKDIVDAGQYILEGPRTTAGEATNLVAIKKEIIDLGESLAKMNQQYHVDLQSLTQALNRTVQPPPRQTYPMYTATALETVPPLQHMFPPGECGFCSDTRHFMRECPVVQEYERAGKCFRNADRKIVLPNGQYIPRALIGRNMAERINRWILQNPPPAQSQQNTPRPQQVFECDQPPHLVAAMSYTICESANTMAFGLVPKPEVEEVIGEEGRVWAQRSKPKERSVPEVVIEKTGPPRGQPKQAAPAAPPSTTRSGTTAPLKPEVIPPSGLLDRKQMAKAAMPVLPQLPAFKYQSLIENPELVKKVIERSMKSEISVSQEELCAISAKVCRYYRENTVNRRIPTVETGAFEEHREALIMSYGSITSSFLLTASPIDSLCVIEMLVNDSHRVVCTLDQGSEIVAMNRSVWKMIGVPLSPEKVLTMESADSNQSLTAGVVENLKFLVGDIDLLLQVHVVDSAPFDILVGRPFFRFTECHTKDYTNRTQELTLTCPNTGKVQTLATKMKPPRQVSFSEDIQVVGSQIVEVIEEEDPAIVELISLDFA